MIEDKVNQDIQRALGELGPLDEDDIAVLREWLDEVRALENNPTNGIDGGLAQ